MKEKDERKRYKRKVFSKRCLRNLSLPSAQGEAYFNSVEKMQSRKKEPTFSFDHSCIERMQTVRLSGETYYLNNQSRLDCSLLEFYSCHF